MKVFLASSSLIRARKSVIVACWSVILVSPKISNAKFKISLDTSKIESLQQDKKKEAEKDKIKMEGVNVVLNMPISQNGKKDLLVNEYGYSEILAESITTTNEDQD